MTKARAAVNAIFFINGFMHANLASRLPMLQELFKLSDGNLGLVLLSTSIGAVIAMPFTGWLIIQNGSKRIGILSVFFYCLFFPLITMVPGIPGLVILFFLMGVSAGMLDVSMNAQAVIVEKGIGKPIMTSFHALFSIGMAFGAICGLGFEKLSIQLGSHLAIITGFCVSTAFWVRYHLIHDKPENQSEGPAFRLPNTAMVSIGVIAFCCMLGEGAMADWSTNYLEKISLIPFWDDESKKYTNYLEWVSLPPKALAPVGLSAFALAMTLGRIFGDRARTKWGDKFLMIICGIISTIGISISLAITDIMAVVPGLFLVGLGLSVIVPIAYSIAGNSTSVSPGVGLAMVTTVGYSGFLFGPPVIGFLADWANLRIALVFVAILFLVMTLLSIRYKGNS